MDLPLPPPPQVARPDVTQMRLVIKPQPRGAAATTPARPDGLQESGVRPTCSRHHPLRLSRFGWDEHGQLRRYDLRERAGGGRRLAAVTNLGRQYPHTSLRHQERHRDGPGAVSVASTTCVTASRQAAAVALS